jgi:hypothetical protein
MITGQRGEAAVPLLFELSHHLGDRRRMPRPGPEEPSGVSERGSWSRR